jgi:hypothetical protein
MSATLTRGASRRKGDIVGPGAGTGGFAGWTGSARIIHDDQGACLEIKLD